ncbi:nucleotidyltransferase family protein, partial [Candidatus Nomurabacteria bacterium]|nr:nucleotidyltransferase family protein [Candidatus Nomurabacteria bacterium]
VKDIWFVVDKLKIDEDIVVIAGDNLFTYDLKESFDIFMKHRKDLILAKRLDSLSDLRRMAVGIIDENNIITDMEEKPKEPKSDIAFFATYFYLRETLPLLTQYLNEGNPPDAPGFFPSWLYKRKPVMAHLFEGECYDIGTFESLEEVRANFVPGK